MKRTWMLVGFVLLIVGLTSFALILRNDDDFEFREGIGGGPPTGTTSTRQDEEIERDIVQELESRGNFTIFLESIRSLGMTDKMRGPERFTVFAPTDESFVNVRSDILYPIVTNRDVLRRLINTHILQGEVLNDELNEGNLINLEGAKLNFSNSRINNVPISEADIQVTNGVIHVIDGIIFSEELIQTITPTGSIE